MNKLRTDRNNYHCEYCNTISRVIGLIVLLWLPSQVQAGKDFVWKSNSAHFITARSRASACAVNNKLYVIGGYNGSSLATVQEYTPGNTYVQSKQNMFNARHDLAVAVVNNKIYAIGGLPTTNIVEEYDASQNTWALKANMPTARSGMAVGVVNNKIYAIGGYEMNCSTNAVEEYDPNTNTWCIKQGMLTARHRVAAGVVNGKIYVIGGENASGYLKTVEEYDPVANTWITKADMPTARSWLSVEVINDKIYAIGGYAGGTSCYSTVEEYDPVANTWITKSSMLTPRYALVTSVIERNIYAICGYGNSGYLNIIEQGSLTTPPSIAYTNGTNYVSDGLHPEVGISTGVFSFRIKYTDEDNDAPKTEYPKVHIYNNGVEIYNSPYSMSYLSGSYNTGAVYEYLISLPAGLYSYSFEAYDVANATATGSTIGFGPTITAVPENNIVWKTKAAMPTARWGLSAAVVNGKIYAIGGYETNKVEEYDPNTNSWTTKANMPTQRRGIGVAVVNNKIYAIGGAIGSGIETNKVEEYDPSNNTWTTKADMPTPRMMFAVGVIDNKIYAIGGSYNIIVSSAVEVYDPQNNVWERKSNMAAARYDCKFAEINNKIYVIGGSYVSGYIPLSTVIEEYNPVQDSWVHLKYALMPRYHFTMEAMNNKIYLIGGMKRGYSVYDDYLNSVEEYDPSTNCNGYKNSIQVRRASCASAVVGNKIYVMGGYDYSLSNPFSSMEEGYFNNAPLLEFAGDENYVNGGVYPTLGDTTTSYAFRIKYADIDNDASAIGYPKVHVLKGGNDISGSPFSMSEYDTSDTDYSNGKTYQYTTALAYGNDYTYYFQAYDSYGFEAIGLPQTTIHGPDVYTDPVGKPSVPTVKSMYSSSGT
ncbi:MAG: hypothetical protein A2293_10090, partial [Elusimicrobia bacterium RIFOXYB2_FULL_49_7]